MFWNVSIKFNLSSVVAHKTVKAIRLLFLRNMDTEQMCLNFLWDRSQRELWYIFSIKIYKENAIVIAIQESIIDLVRVFARSKKTVTQNSWKLQLAVMQYWNVFMPQ